MEKVGRTRNGSEWDAGNAVPEVSSRIRRRHAHSEKQSLFLVSAERDDGEHPAAADRDRQNAVRVGLGAVRRLRYVCCAVQPLRAGRRNEHPLGTDRALGDAVSNVDALLVVEGPDLHIIKRMVSIIVRVRLSQLMQ